MQALSFAVSALLLAGAPAPREAVDCAREISEARQLYQVQASERLAFAAPLVRAVRAVARTLTDEDRALIRGFKEGAVNAGALDRQLWPRLRRAFYRFNAEGCRGLGGVASADELVDGLTAMAGGAGLHTSVVVTCAERGAPSDGRRFLGLRVRADADGPTLVLQGVLERSEGSLLVAGEPPPLRRVALRIALGDREAESAALDGAIAEFTGREADFTWVVPAACQQRLSSAGVAIP